MKRQEALITDSKLHIFIADDDIDDVDFFRNALADISKQIKITVARDGQELLEFLTILIPDIIFLDINMPCMNGIECLAAIRKLKHLDNVPVIIYSTTSYKEHIDKTYELGASMYFIKPSGFETIKARLKEILSLKAADMLPRLPREKYVLNDD